MAAQVAAPPVDLHVPPRDRLRMALVALRPIWSVPAALRAIRAAVVIPGLFALTSLVIGNPQISLFAAFGGFATLVLANFGGERRDKLIAHTELAVTGSVLLVIGTAVHSVTAVAAVVTLFVVFFVLFAGVASSNAASGATAALLAYVLPAASPGRIDQIPDRLAGWWLVSIVGTAAVLLLYVPPPVDRLRRAAGGSATSLADEIDAGLAGSVTPAHREATSQAKRTLLSATTEGPYRPTGLTVPDQAMSDLVEALLWSTSAVSEAFGEGSGCTGASDMDRRRLADSSRVFRLIAVSAEHEDASALQPAVVELNESLMADVEPIPQRVDAYRLHSAYYSRQVAAAARSAGFDTLIAARRIAPADAEAELARWRGLPPDSRDRAVRHPVAQAVQDVVGRHTNLRSIWFLNSARGALSLAIAVAIAGATNVQHGFWVVLGALTVLRTNAASTGSTAIRALIGTTIGFVIGAALIIGIGGNTDALWAALPVAVFVSAYAPGTTPFPVGQAAFTVLLLVLYNLIAPVGWKVGEVRIEDVAIGVGVSALVGVLFWPRGATRVVANDLADAFHTGGLYLVQAAAWALGLREQPPDAAPSVFSAGARLDEALHGLLSEQGTRRVPKEILWALVGGARRLRLTAQGLARRKGGWGHPALDQARVTLAAAVQLAGVYDDLAARLGHTPPTVAQELAGFCLDEDTMDSSDVRVLWVQQYLDHLKTNADALAAPADTVARQLTGPWWR